ncbi:MAG: hypothetical protein ACE37K_20550 [Planctomycetota bacterium]
MTLGWAMHWAECEPGEQTVERMLERLAAARDAGSESVVVWRLDSLAEALRKQFGR